MTMPKPVTVDFETFGIDGRPDYPPKPVGVSIKYWGKPARYYAWGHPSGNNCRMEQAKGELDNAYGDAMHSGGGLLFQNAKFDVDVAETFFGLPRLNWELYHDTLFLLFLDDPHAFDLGLKPSAERLLGLKPEEQDAVGAWLVKNQPVKGVKISLSKQSDHYFGRYIAYAPGDLVGRYANGDVERTERLFKLLYPKTEKRGMLGAYDRERELMPILLEMERQGVRVDLPRLSSDFNAYQGWQTAVDAWVIKALKAPADLNLNSGPKLVEAMIAAKKVDVSLLGVTPTGKPRTDKESLLAGVTDKTLLAVLKYRTQLNTCLRTFMEPWLITAMKSEGLIFTRWNQVKGDVGTRTGRLSSTPNFQNIPKEFSPIFHHQDPKAGLPKSPFKGLPALPLVRGYIIPWAKGHVLLDRDYSQQELRILGHFEDGAIRAGYDKDPWLDFHDFATNMINGMTKKNFSRKHIKNTGFGLLYGMGIPALAKKSDITIEAAKEVKKAYLAIFPGIKAMYDDMRLRGVEKLPIRTWGGREYYCQEPAVVDGQYRTFDYKLVNYLVQGSAADCSKQALIEYWKVKPKTSVLYLSVHDEFLISAPRTQAKTAMKVLREAMEGVKFDVPMLSDGKWSADSWSDLEVFDKKGEIKWAR